MQVCIVHLFLIKTFFLEQDDLLEKTFQGESKCKISFQRTFNNVIYVISCFVTLVGSNVK
jgi:hypothetical protein